MLSSSAAVLPVHDVENTSDIASNKSGTSDDVFDIKGDQFESMESTKQNLTMWDLWALGMMTALGGHFYLWNQAMIAGFGSFIIAAALIASAYGVLILSMAELSSALPFAGLPLLPVFVNQLNFAHRPLTILYCRWCVRRHKSDDGFVRGLHGGLFRHVSVYLLCSNIRNRDGDYDQHAERR